MTKIILFRSHFFSMLAKTSFYREVIAMIVTAWKNGLPLESGVGYGLQLDAADCDRFFQRDWETIELEFEGYANVVKVDVANQAFSNSTCRELIHSEIGRWLIDNGLDSWPMWQPPKLSLKFIGGNRFRLMR